MGRPRSWSQSFQVRYCAECARPTKHSFAAQAVLLAVLLPLHTLDSNERAVSTSK